MNYKNALQERGINVENLSKSLQGQITKLEADYLKIKNAESEELGEEELALIEDAKKELETVDKQIAEKVLKFNPELQRRREENMSKAIATRMAKKENQENQAPAPKVVQLAPKSANNLVKEKLDNIKKEIEEQPIIVKKSVPQRQQTQPQQQQEQQEEQEFDRVEVVKKKRNGIWFAVVGISALALTWGAVNIFKNNK